MTTKPAKTAAKKTAARGRGVHTRNEAGRFVDEYRPEYCKIAVQTLAEGFSVMGLAGKLGVTKQTLYNWRERYPEFDEAIKQGQAGAVFWWEQRARDSAAGGKGNPATIIFGLKNRAADEWRDRIEHTGADGGAIETVSRIEYTVVRPKE